MDRNEILEKLAKDPEIDVLIVGGGINGAGVFLDMAINGVNVLLVDRADFCSGTSATSSHMAHGGIRYLENGEFGLVREAVAERNRMIQNSPHMVKPLPTIIPIFKFWSGLLNAPFKFLNLLDKPAERGGLVIKIGLIFYDSFTGKNRTVPAHQFFNKKETLARYPHINKNVMFTAKYYDGLMLSPERLNSEIILDAEKASKNAMALNYTSLEGVNENGVVLQDSNANQTLTVKPKIIINATGPWIDDVNKNLGLSTRYIYGTKGSHIIVDNPILKEAVGNNEFFFENKDGRIVLLLPFFDKVIIGTSDLPIEDPDTANCSPDEVQYFLDLVKIVFPEIPISQDQIVFTFSGVRPLEYQEAKTTGQITRDHSVKEDQTNGIKVLSLIGGKWTSYRAFGEQVTDSVLEKIGKQRITDTKAMKIGGGQHYPESPESEKQFIANLAAKTLNSIPLVEMLFERYGTVIESILTENNAVEMLDSNQTITKSELVYLAKSEKIVHLDDLLLRRTSIGWLGQVDEKTLHEIAILVGSALNWDTKKIETEIKWVKNQFLIKHNVTV